RPARGTGGEPRPEPGERDGEDEHRRREDVPAASGERGGCHGEDGEERVGRAGVAQSGGHPRGRRRLPELACARVDRRERTAAESAGGEERSEGDEPDDDEHEEEDPEGAAATAGRSEERRVGKEGRTRWTTAT